MGCIVIKVSFLKSRSQYANKWDGYSPIITEPEVNNCFSINTQVTILLKRGIAVSLFKSVIGDKVQKDVAALNWDSFPRA